uniref:Uncharacterized protein n=1 Tax=Oryza barthii TaxID=65489 RepID=A0A0D3HUS0_9ORYZ
MDHQSSGGGHCSNPPSCGFCGRAISFAAVPAGFCTCNVCLRDLAGVLGYLCPLCNFTVHRQGCRRRHPPAAAAAYTQRQQQHQRASSYDQAPVAASSPRASGSRRKRVKTFVIRLVEKVIGPEKNGGGGGGRKKKGKGKGGGGEDEEEEEEEEGYDD